MKLARSGGTGLTESRISDDLRRLGDSLELTQPVRVGVPNLVSHGEPLEPPETCTPKSDYDVFLTDVRKRHEICSEQSLQICTVNV